MLLTEFARLVRDMRAAQREYFDPKRRKPDTIERAKALERKVDQEVLRALGGPTLFDREDPPDGK